MIDENTKMQLEEAMKICNNKDVSTELMLQYMQDYAGVTLEVVINYLEQQEQIGI